jgi:hypothetical protein
MILRYKARLVVHGFSQVPSMDYNETISLILWITSFRVLLVTTAQFRLLIHQVNVRTTFLHGNLHEEIMEQPPDYISKDHPGYVCKLVKSVYGLKQSHANGMNGSLIVCQTLVIPTSNPILMCRANMKKM